MHRRRPWNLRRNVQQERTRPFTDVPLKSTYSISNLYNCRWLHLSAVSIFHIWRFLVHFNSFLKIPNQWQNGLNGSCATSQKILLPFSGALRKCWILCWIIPLKALFLNRETSNKALNAVNEIDLIPFLISFLRARNQLPQSTVNAAGKFNYYSKLVIFHPFYLSSPVSVHTFRR